MGIYLGQLPPAEIARLKAELAETLIANFCYPRFFDNRVEALRMRPVDRAKRQEVWLFLSSVDFTSWSRIDLTSPDFQHQLERLFIQFVQRNRAFFGEQGRRRMSDVRMLINSSASSVVLRLRSHLSGQRQGNPPFGSPRPAVSWSQATATGRPEPGWEQIASATMVLQQQLQELRGEVRPVTVNEPHPTNGASRRSDRFYAAQGSTKTVEQDGISIVQLPTTILSNKSSVTQKPAPANAAVPTAPETPVRKQETPTTPEVPPASPVEKAAAPSVPAAPVRSRSTAQTIAPATSVAAPVAASSRESTTVTIGEDDIAIFEQLRHQMLIWLRVEAIRAGQDISSNLATAQLLDMVRQQAHLDETRLQVVSTLLNLSNQVIKTGKVTLLDYKQALMFHLMHTRR